MGGTIEGNARYAIFLNTLNKIKKGEDLEWVAPDGKKVKLSEFGWCRGWKAEPPCSEA